LRGLDPRDLSRLRLLGTVGEPNKQEVWRWYHDVIGGDGCRVVVTWWQNETGFVETYWRRFAGRRWCFTGVEACYDEEDAIWVLSRDDDGMSVFGHHVPDLRGPADVGPLPCGG
jgi:acyl-coenzyme A synthetase/AMP-(fatty) acid ligase